MKKYFVLFFLVSSILFSQEVEYFPKGLNVKPFTANVLEPRLGFAFKTNVKELRLDVGNSVDLISLKSKHSNLSFGADLFTWTLLKQEANFYFPVDAVDYFFGVNFGLYQNSKYYDYGFRLRISHISAHLVDGHYDKNNLQWINNKLPRVYSREFLELIPFIKIEYLRMYAGLTYLFHTDPIVNKKLVYQVGFDYYRNDLVTKMFFPFIGVDLKIDQNGTKSFNQSYYAGIKFGNAEDKGIKIYYSYLNGMSIHGEYFDSQESYSSIGITIDF
ncbi:DUF1207 domain-containing protein [Stygiobacter electus]|uniref:DUF1207 domain-containing protein n=1 Tax=Stygiobacter electus TaxID=3032292 RepID=A0AAE3P0K7_9BACT|nr:DUF1207 domain-containing protein [Stygiobacter electus]MDF1612109.1 DUF1207 domain-containing protein [Stygiobacter electus]